ncbi:MAG: hypothetical protein AAF762_06460, partial [Pseudomonadota bacterium]
MTAFYHVPPMSPMHTSPGRQELAYVLSSFEKATQNLTKINIKFDTHIAVLKTLNALSCHGYRPSMRDAISNMSLDGLPSSKCSKAS